MFKKLLVALFIFIAGIGMAVAQVDVNQADGAALDSIKGVGPAMVRHILEAREQGGNFKNWGDFQDRVTGVGPKSSLRLSEAGLTVDGKSKFDPVTSVAAPGIASVSKRHPKAAAHQAGAKGNI